MNHLSYQHGPEHNDNKERIFQEAAELIRKDPDFRARIHALLKGTQREEIVLSAPVEPSVILPPSGKTSDHTFLGMPVPSNPSTLEGEARQAFIHELVSAGFLLSYRELSVLAKQIESRNHQSAGRVKKPGFFARLMGKDHQTPTYSPEGDISYHQLFEELWATSERKQSRHTLQEIFELARKHQMKVFKTGEEANHQAKARRYEEKFCYFLTADGYVMCLDGNDYSLTWDQQKPDLKT